MSNINRAVTRTRRAAPGRRGQASLAAMRKTLALAQLHDQMYPPFTVSRRPARSGGGRAPAAGTQRRLLSYAAQNRGTGRPLTPGQNRRWLKKRNEQMKRETGREKATT